MPDVDKERKKKKKKHDVRGNPTIHGNQSRDRRSTLTFRVYDGKNSMKSHRLKRKRNRDANNMMVSIRDSSRRF